MKTKIIFTLVGFLLCAATGNIALATDHGGGSGEFAGGGFHGGRFGGGARFSAAHVGGFTGGALRQTPNALGGARFAGKAFSGQAPSSQFSYYAPARTPTLGSNRVMRQLPTRSTASNEVRSARPTGQQNSTGSSARRNTQLPISQISAAAERAIANHQIYARHDGSWHHEWDKGRFHDWNRHWWCWYGGNWIGFDTGFYPFGYWAYGDYPTDYFGSSYGYYSGYPDSSYDYEYDPSSYYDDSGYDSSGQSSNGVVNAVQSQLAKLGYYRGAVDGILGDETEAAIARYQEDHDLSVTGTVTAATLYSLGLMQTPG